MDYEKNYGSLLLFDRPHKMECLTMIASDSRRCHLPMPFGWFQILYSSDLATGDALPLHYFGQELVAFRTEDGKARVVDAFCPHMGAHLGYGIREHTGKGPKIVGDSIGCPFHGWRWNGEGQCTHIPYARNMPPRVQKGESILGAWHVREINQQILVWYHPEKGGTDLGAPGHSRSLTRRLELGGLPNL